MDFLEAIAGPLADLLRAAADWLDSELPKDGPEVPAEPPRFRINDRGGIEAA